MQNNNNNILRRGTEAFKPSMSEIVRNVAVQQKQSMFKIFQKINLKLCLVVISMFAYGLDLRAQNYTAKVTHAISTDNGLGQNQVTGIVKDHLGFTWITTTGGLSRFDGNNLFSFTSENSIDFFEDSRADGLLYHNGYLYVYSKTGGCIRVSPENGNMTRVCRAGIFDIHIMGNALYVLWNTGALWLIKEGKLITQRQLGDWMPLDMVIQYNGHYGT
jgi:hypothetical protein